MTEGLNQSGERRFGDTGLVEDPNRLRSAVRAAEINYGLDPLVLPSREALIRSAGERFDHNPNPQRTAGVYTRDAVTADSSTVTPRQSKD